MCRLISLALLVTVPLGTAACDGAQSGDALSPVADVGAGTATRLVNFQCEPSYIVNYSGIQQTPIAGRGALTGYAIFDASPTGWRIRNGEFVLSSPSPAEPRRPARASSDSSYQLQRNGDPDVPLIRHGVSIRFAAPVWGVRGFDLQVTDPGLAYAGAARGTALWSDPAESRAMECESLQITLLSLQSGS